MNEAPNNGKSTAVTEPTGEEDIQQLIAALDAEEVPPEVADLDKGGDASAEARGKAAHAFAEQKRRLKAEMQKRAELEAKLKEATSAQRGEQPAPSGNGDDPALVVLAGLTRQAMNNLGLPVVKTPAQQELVRMEVQRLYVRKLDEVDAARTAKARAPQVIEGVFDSMSLDEDLREEVRRRVAEWDPSDQADESKIRRVVYEAAGERSFAGTPPGAKPERAEDAGANAAAASDARAGRRTVTVKPRGQQPTGPKPATQQELGEMRKLGMHDLEAYRAAKQMKGKYLET